MNLRSSSITFRSLSIEEACSKTSALGFNSIEVWRGHLRECKTPELLEQFADLVRSKFGLGVCALNNGGEYFEPFGDKKSVASTVRTLKEAVDVAGLLSTRDILMFEGIRPEERDKSHDMELIPALVAVFQEAIEYSSGKSVRFLVEPHPSTLGMNLQFLTELCDRLDQRYFGVLYDCSHFGVAKPAEYVQAVKVLGSRIKHIHFSDSDQRTSELHFPPGLGKLDLDAIIDAFIEIGYNGSITLDLYGYPLPELASKISIPKLLTAMRRLGLDS